MSDGTEGWITVDGNREKTFLKDCTGMFKVVKETILTENFDLAEKKDENIRAVHQAPKKLAVGDLVEVREWPKKDEASGLTRMKCKTKSGGHIGWATTVGSTGIVFLDVA